MGELMALSSVLFSLLFRLAKISKFADDIRMGETIITEQAILMFQNKINRIANWSIE